VERARGEAEATVIRARADLENERQQAWESRFIYWTTALKAFNSDITVLLLVVLLAAAVGFLLADVLTRAARRL